MKSARIKIKCLSKNRNDKGNIVNYTLLDETGKQFQTTAQQIKNEIQAGRYEFINLQVDKAGRLVDKAEPKATAVKEPKKSKSLGKPDTTIPTPFVVKKPNETEADSRIRALAEKRETAKEELSNYIKMMAKEYTNDNWGEDKFTEDYLGENRMGEKLEDCKMPEIARRYFKKLIDSIENKALDEGIEAFRTDYTDFSVTLSDEVENFIKKSGCETCIKEAMFNLAGQNSKLAIIDCGIDDACDGFVGCKFLTGSYEEAKRFISQQLVEAADNSDESPIDILKNGIYVSDENNLAKVFIIKFYAEVQEHDVKYYRERVYEQYKEVYSSDKEMNIMNMIDILRNTTEGIAYLALNNGFVPPRNYKYTDEDKANIEKIHSNAKLLVKIFEAATK